NGSE
ncbi:hypothetical protein D039_1352B, partial [Vibrio parahaemolyticus EKP-028]